LFGLGGSGLTLLRIGTMTGASSAW
jgi:hypothetical protein